MIIPVKKGNFLVNIKIMKKIWALIGSVLIFTGLKAQEPVKVKKETTPVIKADKSETMVKGKVFPKLEYEAKEESGKYVKVDNVNRKEALKGFVYLKVEGPAYSAESRSFGYLKLEESSIPNTTGVDKYIKAESNARGSVYIKFDGIKGEAGNIKDMYLKVEGNVQEGKNGFVYLKLDASSMKTAAAVDYYLKISPIKGESKD